MEYNYLTYRKESKEPLFKEKFAISRQRYNNQDFVVIKSNSQPTDNNQDKFSKETLTYYRIDQGKISTSHHENNTKNNGQPETLFKVDFNWPGRAASYLLSNKEKNGTATVKINERTILTHDLGVFFQDMLIKGRDEAPFTVLFQNGNSLNLRARCVGEEQVSAKAGNFLCKKFEMAPDFQLISLVAPKIYFWFEAKSPYAYIKYEGPERGLFSPTVVQELVGYKL
ncbi:MAG: hypothetical protein KKC80_03455 [Candidatus Margulisbacteria bacterium]|nr:hypothetical protein [Candidatus Margulisiibacteriota bacterium]MBU1616374.1 hypothetical protein [Candidatus Margulisiibacteriota bacterium]MBU1867533.1 hypothetical protein [Candidatus Margulisiibacteriota bacterium]